MAQVLLSPVFCRLAQEEAAAVLENLPLLQELGYGAEDFGDGRVVLRQIPADIDAGDAEASLSAGAEAVVVTLGKDGCFYSDGIRSGRVPAPKVDALDALSLAQEAGSSKAVNLVLLGRLSNYFADFTEEEWMTAIEQSVPEKFLEMNKKAFHLGRVA